MVSFAQRIVDLAAASPDRIAITCGDERITRAELNGRANSLARDLQANAAGVGDMVTVALPNSIEWFVSVVACWKIGAIPQPVSSRLPRRELEQIVELADPPVVIGTEIDRRTTFPFGYVSTGDDGPLPDATSPAFKAPTSGGSTGRPKLIVSGDPSVLDIEARPWFRIMPDGCMVMPGRLYHNGPLWLSCLALLWGNHVVVLPRFDAEATLAALADHRADFVYLVPTMMKRIWRLPEEVREHCDLRR